jgi:hypothetical protein
MELIRKVFNKISVQIILLYAAVCILTIHFGDRGWYEPDGISILAGSLNLEQAKQGNFFLYAYSLQPLTYELNYLFFRLFKDPYLLYLLPAFFGALSVCLLALSVHFFSRKKINIFCSFCSLLFFPEIFYRLLYPNSSVFGMLFFSLSLLLLSYREENIFIRSEIKYLLIGIFSSLACLFRCDFLLGLPMLAFWVISQRTGKKAFLYYVFGSAVIFIFSFWSGFFNPGQILKISNFYSLLAKEPSYWSREKSLAALFFATNIFIWFILLSYAAIKALRAVYKKNWGSFFILVPLAILFYPVAGGLTSAHYLLSAICFAPLALTKAILDFARSAPAKKIKINLKEFSYALVIFSIFLQFFSLEARQTGRGFPYLIITAKPSYILTHDGSRVSGAYLKGYYQVDKANKFPCLICPLGLAHTIAKMVSHSSSDFIMAYAQQREHNHLVSLGLYSVPFFLQVEGYVLSYAKEGMLLRGKYNKLLIQGLSLKEYDKFNLKGNAQVIKIPLLSRTEPQLGEKLNSFFKSLVK